MKNKPLSKLENLKSRLGPLLLIIMDGIGIGKDSAYNALKAANMQYIDKIIVQSKAQKLYTELNAHGTFVGLPSDDLMGNSEVGHNAIGAGRVIEQRSTITKKSIESGELFKGEKWRKLVAHIQLNESVLHFIGLLSDGYVHSHISHLFGLIKGSRESKIKNVRIHILLDGRDVPPQSALQYIEQLNMKLNKINENSKFNYKIASGGGRMRVTMDRYFSDWNVVKRGWQAHVCGIPEKKENYPGYFKSPQSAIMQARANEPDISDQYLPSFVVIDDNNKPIGKMDNGDGVIFFNFRGDRAIQISKAFDEPNFSEFEKECNPDIFYYGMMLYDDRLNIPKNYFLEPPKIENTLTSYLCNENIAQFSIAETHKFGHIKYFFLGNRDQSPCPDLDEYIEIKSDPSEQIESKPQMKAFEVTNKLLEIINQKKYRFLRVNFANGDMVGHTGNVQAAKIAAETVNECVKELVERIKELGGVAIVTADHGNLENMDTFETSHTLNKVMFAIVDSKFNKEYKINNKLKTPGLGNITATILNLLGFEKPAEFLPSLITINR